MQSLEDAARFIASALEDGAKAITKKYGDQLGPLDMYDPPRIVYDHYTYSSTAGPFGGIGGQIITGFPHVVLVWDYEYVYVYAGRGRGIAGRTTREFQEALAAQANPWTHAHLLRKQEPGGEQP